MVSGIAFSGCIGEDDENGENGEDDNGEDDNGEDDNGEDDNGEDDNGEDDDDDGYVGSGTETYSGTWEGEDATGDEYDGTWEFTVDWENEDVSGWFYGDAEGDIEGSVSAGEIDAAGEAGLGYVTWEGTFTADGSSVSGNWEIEAQGLTTHSGTWTGEIGELENGNGDDDDDEEEEEEPLPEEDQVEGDEPMERYPDSVMLTYDHISHPDGNVTEIEYGTYDSLDDVVDWYEDEFGDPAQKEAEEGQTTLRYIFGEDNNEFAEIVISEGDDYTEIDLEYAVEH